MASRIGKRRGASVLVVTEWSRCAPLSTTPGEAGGRSGRGGEERRVGLFSRRRAPFAPLLTNLAEPVKLTPRPLDIKRKDHPELEPLNGNDTEGLAQKRKQYLEQRTLTMVKEKGEQEI